MDSSAAPWNLHHADGLLLATCVVFDAVPGVRHAFSTRRAHDGDGAPDGFDLGGARPDPRIAARRERLVRAAGLPDRRPVALSQVHGNGVVCVDRDADGALDRPAEADGGIVLRPAASSRIAAVRTADCVALLLGDDGGRAVAALHAGWRGIAAGIVDLAIAELDRRGIGAAGLRVALGPAIGPCCYEVGPEVRRSIELAIGPEAEAAFAPLGGDRAALDLHAALALQLARAGVGPSRVSGAPWCTACRADLFFSHRRDKAGTGRMMALVGWAFAP